MADQAKEADAPTRKKKPWRRRVLPQTSAGKASSFAAIALLSLLIVVWLLRLFGPDGVNVVHGIGLLHAFGEIALAALIPMVLYWGLRRWNQSTEGQFPDIDRAWEAGIAALEAKGISTKDYPIFLILGSSDEEDERGLMEALDSPLLIHGVPESNGVAHALKWYVSSEALYLFCSGASSLSVLMNRMKGRSVQRPRVMRVGDVASRGEQLLPTPKTRPLPKVERSSVGAGDSVSTSSPRNETKSPPPPRPREPQSSSQGYLGTIQQHSLDPVASPARMSPMKAPPSESPSPAARTSRMKAPPSTDDSLRPAARHDGTLMFNQTIGAEVEPNRSKTPTATIEQSSPQADPRRVAAAPKTSSVSVPLVSATKKIALPDALDTSDQLERLKYVCRLLKKRRQPLCGVNGTVTLLPFELSQVGPLQLAAIAQSARNDVTTIQKTLGVHSPVTALLVGLEREAGFIELVRRLGDDLLSRRLGGRFDLRSRPTPNELNTHSDRLCDAFEDWVHRLFSREDGLAQQRGNRKLYSLTCRIRHELKPRLRIVLGQAFGCDSTQSDAANDDSLFFSGCYFAGSGVETGQPAFVKGVLRDKLIEEQSKVQWSRDMLKRDRLVRVSRIAGWLLALLLLIALIARLWFR
ncbi:MAG: type VI secretion protein IcmF/TssM N-terminal domain-containing protein [Planctomycetota bacterium]